MEVTKKVDNEMKVADEEIKSLKNEITDLKNEIKRKEKELLKSTFENEELKKKLNLKQTNTHSEKDLLEENSDIQQLIKDHPENHEIITKVSNIKQTTYSCKNVV